MCNIKVVITKPVHRMALKRDIPEIKEKKKEDVSSDIIV